MAEQILNQSRRDKELCEEDTFQPASDEEVTEISKKLMERNAEVYQELAR